MCEYTLRFATEADAAIITQHRYRMFSEMGGYDQTKLQAMCPAFEVWVQHELASGRYAGALVKCMGEIVAGAGMWMEPRAPGPTDAATIGAKIFNVYVNPEHRRQGLARRMMHALLTEAEQRHLKTIVLHASRTGRPLYESMGFEETNELRLLLD